MLIRTLKIKDIRKFDNFSCEFGPGLNIVLGDNFAGKTTICEAIFFGLFGETIKGKSYVKMLPRHNSISSEISLTLTNGQDNIQITKNIPINTTVSVSSQNQHRTFSSAAEVNRFFGELFHRNENAFRFGFLSESEVVEFITMSKSDKRDLLYGIAGIDTLERIRDLFIENRKQSKRDEKGIQMEAAGLDGQLDFSVEEQFIKAKNRKDELQQEYEAMLDSVVTVSGSENMSSIQADLNRLIKERDEKQRDLLNKLGSFKDLDSIEDYLRELDKKEKELEEKIREFDILDQRVKNGKAFLNQIDAHLDELNKISAVSDPKCTLCLQPVEGDTLSRVISTNLTKKCKAEELLAELQDRLNKLKAEIGRYKTELLDKPDIMARRDVVRILSQDIGKINENIKSKEKLLGPKTAAARPAEAPEKNLDSLKVSLDMAAKVYEELLIRKTVHDQNAEKYRVYMDKLKAAQKTRAICEAAVAATEKCLERVIRDIFVTAGDSITSFINDLGVLPGYQVRLSTDDYMPVVYRMNKKIDINTLSGSEKSLIYIGLKLAVAAAFQNQFLVLDDPTIYLDPTRQKNFIRSMYALSHSGKQIILMTSNPDMAIDEANLIRI